MEIEILFEHIFFWISNQSVISDNWAQTALN